MLGIDPTTVTDASSNLFNNALLAINEGLKSRRKLTPDEMRRIADLKKSAKSITTETNAEIRKLLDDYKTLVKKNTAESAINPCNPTAFVNLASILTTAHDKSEEERQKTVGWFTKIGVMVRDLTIGSKTLFPQIQSLINSYSTKINSIYTQFQTGVTELMKGKNKPTPQDLLKLGGLHAQTRNEMKNFTDALGPAINKYIDHKIDDAQYFFKAVFDEIKNHSGPGTLQIKPEDYKNLTNNLPCTLAFIKILASISGIRSTGSTDKKQWGEFGTGFIARVCFGIDEKMNKTLNELASKAE